MRFWLIGLAGLVGCQQYWDDDGPKPKTPEQVQDEYESQLANARAETLDQMHSPSCARNATGGTCGLISTQLRKTGARKFIETNCGETVETVSASCAERFQKTLKTALSRKYSHSIASEVESACSEEPEQCASMELLELQYINSHNKSLAAEWTRRSEDITRDARKAQRNAQAAERAAAREQEARAEASRRYQAAAQALSTIGQAMIARGSEKKTEVIILPDCTNKYQCASGHHCYIPKMSPSGMCVPD